MKKVKTLLVSTLFVSYLVCSATLETEKQIIGSLIQDSCGVSVDNDEVNGKIFIKNFSLEESYMEVIKDKKGKTFKFSFFSRAPIDLCNDIKYAPGVGAYWVTCSISTPLEKGTYSLRSFKNLNMKSFVFINKFGNKYRKLNAQCGLLEITDLKEDVVTGKLIAYGDENSFVSGSFVASKCSK